VMEAQYLPSISLFLVAVHCGELTHVDLKHKGALDIDIWGRQQKEWYRHDI